MKNMLKKVRTKWHNDIISKLDAISLKMDNKNIVNNQVNPDSPIISTEISPNDMMMRTPGATKEGYLRVSAEAINCIKLALKMSGQNDDAINYKYI